MPPGNRLSLAIWRFLDDVSARQGPPRFSAAAAGGRCPKCSGTSFKAKRSLGGKLAMGVLAPKERVECQTCGTTFERG